MYAAVSRNTTGIPPMTAIAVIRPPSGGTSNLSWSWNATTSPSPRCLEYQTRSGSPATPAMKIRVCVAAMIVKGGGARFSSTSPFSTFCSFVRRTESASSSLTVETVVRSSTAGLVRYRFGFAVAAGSCEVTA